MVLLSNIYCRLILWFLNQGLGGEKDIAIELLLHDSTHGCCNNILLLYLR